MTLLVDTNVWSLTYRRDVAAAAPEAQELIAAITRGDPIVSTGLVLQELLQGFHGPRDRQLILDKFAAVPMLVPEHEDHLAAADLFSRCRRAGRQVETIDILLAQLCLRYDLTMLSADKVFASIAPLRGSQGVGGVAGSARYSITFVAWISTDCGIGEADGLGGLQVDDEVETGRLQPGHLARLSALAGSRQHSPRTLAPSVPDSWAP